MNEDSRSDSDSSPLEEDDPGCLDAFEEITEQSDLDAFSTILKAAQKVALTVERKNEHLTQGTCEQHIIVARRFALILHQRDSFLLANSWLGLK